MNSTPTVSQIIPLEKLLIEGEKRPDLEWQLTAIRSEECLSYVAWNTRSKEAVLIDPKEEDHAAYGSKSSELKGYQWLGVIDTHTHADHVSIAARMAEELDTPLVMHVLSPSQRVHLRVARQTKVSSRAAPLQFIFSPGHTPDSISLLWGPFLFSGDTLLFGDTGRDDLPGGDAAAHYDSIQEIKKFVKMETLVLPGHDNKGGRASSWATQLKLNSSLTQERAAFIEEASAFDAPAPKLLKKSLKENFR